jgi:RNA polymerase sigma-70 factor, ECF subfamily
LQLIERDDEMWVRDLSTPGAVQEDALATLGQRLLAGLRASRIGRDGKDHAVLEDAVQNTLVLILGKLATYRRTARFLTWATTIAVHAVITETRRRRWADVSLEAVTGSSTSFDPSDSSPSAETHSGRVELLKRMDDMIQEELTDKQRMVIRAELSGLPLEEIAQRLGTNKNAVYKLAHDARRSLKTRLEAAGYMAADVAELWATPTGGNY